MTVIFDPTNDFVTVVDGLQLVAVRDRDGNVAPVEHALRRAVSTREAAASNGLYRTDDVHWHLPITEHPASPVMGGTITDEADEWTILMVERQTLSVRWRCTCRNLIVAERLDTLISIEAANYARAADGAHEPTWLPWQTDLRARIQPETADRTVEHGRKLLSTRGRVYLREQLAVTTNHRVIASDGAIWKVTGTESPERIDQLFTILVEKTPWPLG